VVGIIGRMVEKYKFLLLLVIVGCSKQGHLTNFNRISSSYNDDVNFIKGDSLLKKYCNDNYGLYGYNCDSIVDIRSFNGKSTKQVNDEAEDSRSYLISFFLEYDYQFVSVFNYRFQNDSVLVFRNMARNGSEFNFVLLTSRSCIME
jgi:hypothetical protein